MSQPAQALAQHLVSQTLASVGLLEQLGVVSADDAAVIRSRLPGPYATFPQLDAAAGPTPVVTTGVGALAGQFNNLGVNPTPTPTPKLPARNPPASAVATPTPPPAPVAPAPAPAPAPVPAAPEPEVIRARALWDYSGTEADDLQFNQGQTIIIDDEVNDQWCRGRVEGEGRTGLFPSNYVEKIAPTQAYGSNANAHANGYYSEKQEYNAPAYGQQHQQHQYQVQQPDQGHTIVVQDGKKKKFDGMGEKFATAAVGGAGFGVGSALAGGLVNAIF